MEYITALKTLHIAAITLWLLSALGLALRVIKTRAHDRLLQRPALFAWLLMAVCLAVLPFSGWWLVHLLGLSLGQTWVLASSVLYVLGLFSWVWLVSRLVGKAGRLRFTLVLAIISAACFMAIAGLMVFKPA
ncbi:DUF2269 family protein [Pseudomonas capsici]|uniref:DUF2269 family protein n=1 Tax=Pseudomonas capsici TaxID=2810614 RepID=UPI0019D07692|nr:DUF2269 family protein [Pseudomonas capsici]MBN6722173.1 DUF2269 family protein [Pseudomonas capsici]MBN6727071.1 DUF2269 family protein [Pseudomonas capsici]